jgi:Domain of unknown function (DUF3402)
VEENGAKVNLLLRFIQSTAYVFFGITANMKVITSIYLNCRPDLRDEWLAGNELEDPGDSAVSKQPAPLCSLPFGPMCYL